MIIIAFGFGLICVCLLILLNRNIARERQQQREQSDMQAVALAKKTASQQFISLKHYRSALSQMEDLRRGAYGGYTKAQIGALIEQLRSDYYTAMALGDLPEALYGTEKLF